MVSTKKKRRQELSHNQDTHTFTPYHRDSDSSVRDNPPGKDLSVFECEYIIVALMLQQLIAADVQYTAYE